jgi:hypothetical protein
LYYEFGLSAFALGKDELRRMSEFGATKFTKDGVSQKHDHFQI